MDWFGFFSCMQLFIIIGVCFAIIYRNKLIEFEQRIRNRKHRHHVRQLETVGFSVVPAPAMTANEIVRIMNDWSVEND